MTSLPVANKWNSSKKRFGWTKDTLPILTIYCHSDHMGCVEIVETGRLTSTVYVKYEESLKWHYRVVCNWFMFYDWWLVFHANDERYCQLCRVKHVASFLVQDHLLPSHKSEKTALSQKHAEERLVCARFFDRKDTALNQHFCGIKWNPQVPVQ